MLIQTFLSCLKNREKKKLLLMCSQIVEVCTTYSRRGRAHRLKTGALIYFRQKISITMTDYLLQYTTTGTKKTIKKIKNLFNFIHMLNTLCKTLSTFWNKSIKMEFSEVKQGLEANSILLIDVRNPDEVQNLGRIPGSHNIPRKCLNI